MSIGNGPLSALGIAPPGASDMWAMIDKDQMYKDMMLAAQNSPISQVQQAGAQNFPYKSPPPPPLSPVPDLAARAREIFLKRMGTIRAEMRVGNEDFLQCHIYNDQVYVFYCFGGRHGVTFEGIDLFPSDQLITQFRLVLT